MTSIYGRRALFRSAIAALLVGGLVSGGLVLANLAETEPTGGIGGPFELTSHRGEAVSDRSLRGRLRAAVQKSATVAAA